MHGLQKISLIVSLLVAIIVLAGPSGTRAQPVEDTAHGTDAALAEAGWGEMTPEQREQAIEYSNTKYTLYFVSVGYGILVLLFILFTGFSNKIRDWAKAIGKKRFFVLALYLLFFLVVTTALSLPLDFYSGYLLEHKYELSNQTVGGWVWDQAKTFIITWIILIIVVGIMYVLIRKYPRGWWAWFGIGSIPFVVFFVVIAPVVLMPMFYTYTPLEESPLRERIINLAAEEGIEDADIFEMDASKNTKKLNAMVTGLGDTKRIILYDNMLQQMEDDEILFVVGHEMGHYIMHHVWIAVFISAVCIFIFCFLTNLMIRRVIKKYSHRFGFSRLSDFASFPLVMVFISVFMFLFSPITNGISRHFEHQADIFGMERTGDGDAAARAFEKLAAANLSNPNPSAFIEFWLYGHPKLSDRVRFVRSYQPESARTDPLRFPGERHLRNVRQLTFGGQNAGACFSPDGTRLIFQATRDTFACDQIFMMNTADQAIKLVSSGRGVTSCPFFAPDGGRIVFNSTHLGGEDCPPKLSDEQGYVQSICPDYDVFSLGSDGSDPVCLTDTPGYDAEAAYSPDGQSIVFTSVRDGDLELYLMDPEGKNVRRLTHDIGYDGGAFFSPDGARIVYRAFHPGEPKEIAAYQDLLTDNLVRLSHVEIFVMDIDGSNRRQITGNGASNLCPVFHPNGRQIIFTSNMNDPDGHNFDLYLVNDDGTGLERVTYDATFDAFPMFSPDGAKLVFASSRNSRAPDEINLFFADWVE